MASITITRDSGYADRLRAYKVVLDGSEIGTISNGESKTFPIAPGSHNLVLKIDWCGSKTVEFEVTPEGSVEFDCGSNLRGANLFLGIYYILFARDQYLWLKAVEDGESIKPPA